MTILNIEFVEHRITYFSYVIDPDFTHIVTNCDLLTRVSPGHSIQSWVTVDIGTCCRNLEKYQQSVSSYFLPLQYINKIHKWIILQTSTFSLSYHIRMKDEIKKTQWMALVYKYFFLKHPPVRDGHTSVSWFRFQRSILPDPSTAVKRAGWMGDQATSYT